MRVPLRLTATRGRTAISDSSILYLITPTYLARVIARNIKLKISQNWQGFEEESYHLIQPCNAG
ncbi:MAG: hypothetical protein AAFN00_03290 [Cyanobacteria bacterium J06558_2]